MYGDQHHLTKRLSGWLSYRCIYVAEKAFGERLLYLYYGLYNDYQAWLDKVPDSVYNLLGSTDQFQRGTEYLRLVIDL